MFNLLRLARSQATQRHSRDRNRNLFCSISADMQMILPTFDARSETSNARRRLNSSLTGSNLPSSWHHASCRAPEGALSILSAGPRRAGLHFRMVPVASGAHWRKRDGTATFGKNGNGRALARAAASIPSFSVCILTTSTAAAVAAACDRSGRAIDARPGARGTHSDQPGGEAPSSLRRDLRTISNRADPIRQLASTKIPGRPSAGTSSGGMAST